MNIGDRIKTLRGGTSQDEFAKDLGVHKNTLGKYERGERIPDSEFLNKVLEVCPKADPTWLLTGSRAQGSPEKGDAHGIKEGPIGWQTLPSIDLKHDKVPAPPHRRLDDRYVYIPLYDVRASAGGGAVVNQENVLDFLSFKADWIRSQLYASPGDLYLIHVEGESMEPTLRPGDVILVDHREASTLPRDGIYVMQMDGTLLVKRLQRLPGGIVKVTSDNAAYDSFNVNLGTDVNGVKIVGRVVWCGRRM